MNYKYDDNLLRFFYPIRLFKIMESANALMYIANGRISELFDCILPEVFEKRSAGKVLSDKELELLALSNQFHSLNTNLSNSTITFDEYWIDMNRITRSLLDLFNRRMVLVC